MKLRDAWKGGAVANRSTGKADLELQEHLTETKQMHLPHSAIMIGCLDLLKEKGLIEEAYLRGSFGRGYGDIHSDIDFFSVVKPENLEKAYDAVTEYLMQQGSLLTGCHDRLVADYGGIGFMFIAYNKANDLVFQFDLYMAMMGVAPAMECSIKPRIYSKDPGYRWMEEYGNARDMDALPAVAKNFIKKHTEGKDGADRMELIMQESLLNIFVTDKHIKRGQWSRTIVDNQFLTASVIEMLQLVTGYTSTGYSPVYLGGEVASFCRQHGDAALANAGKRLEKLFTQKMSQQKLRDVLSLCKDILQQTYPEQFERQKAAIAFFEKEVLAPQAPAKPAPQKRLRHK